MLISPLAQKVARNLRQGITAPEIASETGLPLERVEVALYELQSRMLVSIDGYGQIHYADPNVNDEGGIQK